MKHLYGNWKKKYYDIDLKEVIWSAARAITITGWERAMSRITTLDEAAWKEMNDIPPKFWTRSHFNTFSKCDMQVNNMCETFNSALLEHKNKPIITLLEGIKQYLTKRITTQKEMMSKYTGEICLRILLILEKNKKVAGGRSPTWHGDDDLAIFGVTNDIETYCVNLKNKTCA